MCSRYIATQIEVLCTLYIIQSKNKRCTYHARWYTMNEGWGIVTREHVCCYVYTIFTQKAHSLDSPKKNSDRELNFRRSLGSTGIQSTILRTNRRDIFLDVFFCRASPARALNHAGLPRRHGVRCRKDVSDDVCIQR